MIDMHVHSSLSIEAKDTFMLRQLALGETDINTSSSVADKESPERMIEQAFNKGISTVAITDHWSIGGIEIASRKSYELGLEYINGIEIGALLEVGGTGYEVHILGYFFNLMDQGLRRLCRDAKKLCGLGASAFLEGLSHFDIDITREDVEEECSGSFSSWGIRRILIRRGYAQNKIDSSQIQQRAVAHILENSPGHPILKENGILNAGDVIRVLHNAGASVFMAHPFWLTRPQQGGCPEQTIWKHINAMLALGVDGLEVYSPGNTGSQSDMLLEFCRNQQIPACGGSDSCNKRSLLQSPAIDREIITGIKYYRDGLSPWE